MCASPREVTASAPLGSVSPNATSPSLLSHMLAFVSSCGGFSWYRYPGQQGLIRHNTHTLFAKECLRMPLVALPASFQQSTALVSQCSLHCFFT